MGFAEGIFRIGAVLQDAEDAAPAERNCSSESTFIPDDPCARDERLC